MRYRRLGPSGLFVSELCLGTMTFGGSGGIWGQIGQLQQEEAESEPDQGHGRIGERLPEQVERAVELDVEADKQQANGEGGDNHED